MADSCRPVSRHGRYHAADRRLSSNVPYTEEVPSYSAIEYVDKDDVYGYAQKSVRMEPMERPQTRLGRRTPTPQGFDFSSDDEDTGRPVSRRGHDYDDYSRQALTLDRQISSSDAGSNSTSPIMGTSPVNKPPPVPRTPSRDSQYNARSQMSPSLRRRKLSGSHNPSPSPRPSPRARPPSASKYGRSPREHHDMSHHDQMYINDPNVYQGQSYTSPLPPRPASGSKLRSSRPSSRENDFRQPYNDNSSYHMQEQPISRNPQFDSYENYRPINNSPVGYNDQHDYQPVHNEQDPPVRKPRPTTGYKNRAKSARAKSARKRTPRSARKQEMELASESTIIDNLPPTETMRPTSSLTRYKVLPAIGTPRGPQREATLMGDLSMQTSGLNIDEPSGGRRMSEDSFVSHSDHSRPLYRMGSDLHSQSQEDSTARRLSGSSENKSMDFTDSVEHFQPHKLPEEPTETDGTSVLLAVRLPDGQRQQRFFRVTDKLNVVLQFAENLCNCDLSAYNLASNIPKVVFTDLSQLVGESGLESKTMLYLQEK